MAQKVTIEDTRYCPAVLHIMHSALYGQSRRHSFAEGKQLIALSDRTLDGPVEERPRGACPLIPVGSLVSQVPSVSRVSQTCQLSGRF
jgi:hypothetical protein